MDLLHLLHELHNDKGEEDAAWGIPSIVEGKPSPPSAYNSILPSEPPPIPDPPIFSQSRFVSAPSLPNPSTTSLNAKKPKPSLYQWRKVLKRPSAPSTHLLASFIPTYAWDVNGRLTAKGIDSKQCETSGGTSSSTICDDYLSGQAYGTGGDREMRGKVAESMKRKVAEIMKRRRKLLE